jgi:hypothetical protein
MRRAFFPLVNLLLCPLAALAQPRVTVTLFDLAGLSPQTIREMKAETTKIFRAAGVEIDWLDCELAGKPVNLAVCAEPLGPTRLMLHLIPGVNKTKPKASGMAFVEGGAGVFACLYPDRVRELASGANWEFGDLLGHAAAHEIGHLLLGSNAHSPAGVMRARWETEDLRRLSHEGLTFLKGQLRSVQTAVRQAPVAERSQR